MRIVQFDRLSMKDKAGLLMEFGEELMGVVFANYRVSLYSLNGSLIEVKYNLDIRKIDRIELTKYQDLDKYLFKIDIITSLRTLNF